MKWHKMTPFPTRYCLATPQELQEWGKKQKLEIPNLAGDALGGTYNAGGYIFVAISDRKLPAYWAAVDIIIHESVHVFQKAMTYCEEPTLGTETQAYHIAAIATNLLKDYMKREELECPT
jgi:hypothetical protein